MSQNLDPRLRGGDIRNALFTKLIIRVIPLKTVILIIAVILIAGTIWYLDAAKTGAPLRTSESADVIVGGPAANGAEAATSTIAGETKLMAEQQSQLVATREERIAAKRKKYEAAKEIVRPAGFVNTERVTVQEHVGRSVVLVDFWTYSCINCQRTLPYLKAWHERYKDSGLVIIGVHTPEFDFEKDYANVRRAAEKFGVAYPVVLDNDYGTWSAYGNRYWPRKYLIDIDGFIVYDHIGEGAYDETEEKIRGLLEERRVALGVREEMPKKMARVEESENVSSLPRSPEIYFGALRNNWLGNGRSHATGPQTLAEPAGIKTNILYLAGEWNFADEFTENKSAGAKIIFRYQAEKVFTVLSADHPVEIDVLRDGRPLGAERGQHVQTRPDGTTFVRVFDAGLYRLIEDPAGHGEYTLEIIIKDPGIKAFTFTFG
ncbi:MAG: redoxin family protein [Patescibacteria group bacterium]